MKNQHQQVLWYLINSDFPFSLKYVIADSMFYKFQTRLGEIESKHGVITHKTKKSFLNRFKRVCTYTKYEAIDKNKCKELLKTYER